MCLSELKRGQSARVETIADEQLRVQLLRFGIAAGCRVICHTRLWAGPVVLRFGGQEIALGREMARQIQVTP